MRRLNLRAVMLLWQQLFKSRLIFPVIGIVLFIYFYRSGITKTNIIIAKEGLIQTQEITEPKTHHFEGKQQGKVFVEDYKENKQQIGRSGFLNKTDRELKLINDIKKHSAVEHNVEKQNTSTDETFSPGAYPCTFNMTGILRQFDMKGFAVEKPVNKFDYSYIENPDHICKSPEKVKVLFIIKSSIGNTLRRETIRETWANRKRFPSIRIVFSFGKPKHDTRLASLMEESSTYNDMLIVKDYVDSYRNLTLKTMGGLKWAVTHCAHAQYVVSVDDDVYVAPDLLFRYLNRPQIQMIDKLYSGRLYRGTKPIRNPKDKWMISKADYPFEDFPDYAFGGFVTMSMPTVRSFTVAAMYTKLLQLEDVYLGILAAKVGIKARNNEYVNSRKTFTVSESFRSLIASHFYSTPKDLQRAWNCHLSILDQEDDKSIFCDYIGNRLQKLKSEIDSIVGWMEDVKFNS